MIAVAVVLIVLGIIGLFVVPPFGGIPGIVGLLLLLAFLFGFGRRTQAQQP